MDDAGRGISGLSLRHITERGSRFVANPFLFLGSLLQDFLFFCVIVWHRATQISLPLEVFVDRLVQPKQRKRTVYFTVMWVRSQF